VKLLEFLRIGAGEIGGDAATASPILPVFQLNVNQYSFDEQWLDTVANAPQDQTHATVPQPLSLSADSNKDGSPAAGSLVPNGRVRVGRQLLAHRCAEALIYAGAAVLLAELRNIVDLQRAARAQEDQS
jgi:hypothetical protein